MSTQSIPYGEPDCLTHWLKETYGSADPARVRKIEAGQFQESGWRFFFGSLNIPSHGGAYAVAVHDGAVWEGEAGLAEFFRDRDLYHHSDALPVDKLAGIVMFFLSHYGAGDAMLITDPSEQGKPWEKRFRRLLHRPKILLQGEALLLQFWYLQRTLIRVDLQVDQSNAFTYEKKVISELL